MGSREKTNSTFPGPEHTKEEGENMASFFNLFKHLSGFLVSYLDKEFF